MSQSNRNLSKLIACIFNDTKEVVTLSGSIIFSTDGEKSTSAVFAIMVYKKGDEKR